MTNNSPIGEHHYPKARKIDESGKDLSEDQRHCKLNNEIRGLKIFNTYTRAACMFECKMKYALASCDCLPWDYPYAYSKVSGGM